MADERSKDKEPHSGRLLKSGKGIFISPDVTADRFGNISIHNTEIDEYELRKCALYWDKICNPYSSTVYFGNPAQTEFLVDIGLMECPPVHSEFSNNYPRDLIDYFYRKNIKDPAAWSMSESMSRFLKESGDLQGSNGAIFEIYSAIPIPDKQVPLEELLDFKLKRKDQIESLQLCLDAIYSRVINSGNPDWELRRALREVEKNCRDVIRVGREVQMPWKSSNWKISFSGETSLSEIFQGVTLGAALGAAGGLTVGMPDLGAFIGGVLPFCKIGISSSIPEKKSQLRKSPYLFASTINNSPI